MYRQPSVLIIPQILLPGVSRLYKDPDTRPPEDPIDLISKLSRYVGAWNNGSTSKHKPVASVAAR